MQQSRLLLAPLRRRWAWWTLGSLVLILCWDALEFYYGWDFRLAAWMGGNNGFELRENFWFSTVLHRRARDFAWVLYFVVVYLCVFKRVGLGTLSGIACAGMLLSTLFVGSAVPSLKRLNDTICPWDVDAFGGHFRYQSHWDNALEWLQNLATFTQTSGGAKPETVHCFPGGHAVAGFAFLALYFWLAKPLPHLAKWALGVSIGLGMVFGITQQIRGAHFLSHNLWAAWLCWSLGWLLFELGSILINMRKRHRPI